MSGHDDLQSGKKEVFRFGDWSIYDATEMGGVTNRRWNSFILHCSTWKEWEPVKRPPATTGLKGVYVDNFDKPYQIQVTKRCNTNMLPVDSSRCPKCLIKIPNEVVALWKLQNFDKIQEFNSV